MLDIRQLYDTIAHDAVWPTTGFKTRPTFEEVKQIVQNASDIYVMPEGGFVVMSRHASEPDVADVHSGFLPRVRGLQALQFCLNVVQACPYRRLETWCHPEFREAVVFAKKVGFKQEGEKLVLTKA